MAAEQPGRTRRRPRGLIILALLVLGAVAGLVIAGVGATALQLTSTNDFCLTCHEMQPFYDEYVGTTHHANAAGVRASCADCHLPQHSWLAYTLAKAEAGAHDVWAHVVRGLDTPEKLLGRRGRLAERVWAEMRADGSRACKNCHGAAAMDFAAQSETAAAVHRRVLDGGGRTCIDCHRGLAHALPQRTEDHRDEDQNGARRRGRPERDAGGGAGRGAG